MKILKRIIFVLFLLGIISPVAILGYYLVNYGYETEKLVNYKPRLTTTIYDKNGKKIANLFDKQHRYYATIDEIPPRMVESLLAIEDTTFFEHSGVNVDAILRAIIKDIKARKMVEGASTITQQLVKNTLLTREKKLSRKIKEVIFALKVENELTKEEILERYFNEIYLGHGYYGVKTAASGYFRKKLSQLTLKEMAILVGLPKAPSFYAPTKNYEVSLGRANRVITRLATLGWINEDDYIKAINERPRVYNDTLTQNRAPYITDEVVRRLKPYFKDIKTGGYEIHTTIDLNLQLSAQMSLKYAYELAVERFKSRGDNNETQLKELNGALVSVEPSTGNVLALVGGVDYRKSAYNRATMGRRQPGSAFKPFIYQAALDLGYSGATDLVDISRTYSYKKNGKTQSWKPKNYEKNFKGFITLREALVHSRNLATINLVTDIGLKNLFKELDRYGIKNLPHDLSISLGTISLSPYDLAKYYTSFANDGVQHELVLISKVENVKGSEWLFDSKSKYITSKEQNFLLTSILRDVVERGTGRKANVKGIEIAGKTGTTNKSVDAWFAGYSPSIETVVWFGNDNNSPMKRYETGGRVSGPAFRKYYEELIRLYPQVKRKFDIPEGVVERVYKGKKEYFTEISKPPVTDKEIGIDDELIF